MAKLYPLNHPTIRQLYPTVVSIFLDEKPQVSNAKQLMMKGFEEAKAQAKQRRRDIM